MTIDVTDTLTDEQVRDREGVDLYCQRGLIPFDEQWAFTDDVGTLRPVRRSR